MSRELLSKQYPKATALYIMKLVNRQLVDAESGGIDFLEFRDDAENSPGVYVSGVFDGMFPEGEVGFEAGNMLAWKPACDMENGPHPRTAPSLPETFTAAELAAFMLYGPGKAIQELLGPIGNLDEAALIKIGGKQGKWEQEAIGAAYEAARQAQDVVGAPNFEADDYVSRDAWIKAMVCQLLEPAPATSEHPAEIEPQALHQSEREEPACLRPEAEARRQERKAAETRAAEEDRLAAERAEIARQCEAQEAKARAERAELDRQAAELHAQQEAIRLEGERIAAERRAADEKVRTEREEAGRIEADARHIEQVPNQSELGEEASSTQTTLDTGVSKGEILAVFTDPIRGQTKEQWKRMLGDVPRWLKEARIDAGGRSIQSRWNPAKLAMCLAGKGSMGRGALGSLIRRHFPEYLPEWEAYAGSFERR